jgi:hypothetical protein
MGIFGFKPKEKEVLNHWISFVDGFSFPSQDFYATVEAQAAARNIPSMDISRVKISEGGLLSHNRTYLRMMRERLAFDTCAAPFGNIFFFSCRTTYIPAEVKLWHLIAVCAFLVLVFLPLYKFLGMTLAAVALLALVLAIAQVFQNTIAMGLSDVDRILMKIPAIGPIYERWFRKETYYREDTRLLYLKILPDLIKEIAEEIVAAKGAKLTAQFERAPILGELYKPVGREKAADKG